MIDRRRAGVHRDPHAAARGRAGCRAPGAPDPCVSRPPAPAWTAPRRRHPPRRTRRSSRHAGRPCPASARRPGRGSRPDPWRTPVARHARPERRSRRSRRPAPWSPDRVSSGTVSPYPVLVSMQVVPPAIISARCQRAIASSSGSPAARVAATVLACRRPGTAARPSGRRTRRRDRRRRRRVNGSRPSPAACPAVDVRARSAAGAASGRPTQTIRPSRMTTAASGMTPSSPGPAAGSFVTSSEIPVSTCRDVISTGATISSPRLGRSRPRGAVRDPRTRTWFPSLARTNPPTTTTLTSWAVAHITSCSGAAPAVRALSVPMATRSAGAPTASRPPGESIAACECSSAADQSSRGAKTPRRPPANRSPYSSPRAWRTGRR